MEEKDKNNLFDDEEVEILDDSSTLTSDDFTDYNYSDYSVSGSPLDYQIPKYNDVKNPIETARNVAGGAAETAGNITKGAGNVADAAGKGMQTAGKGMKAAGKSMEVAGKGVQAAGEGIKGASDAAGSALNAIPVVGGVLGGGVKALGNAAGTGAKAVGKGTELAGKGAQKAGEVTENAGETTEKAGNKVKEAGDKAKTLGKNIKNNSKDDEKISNAKSKPYKFGSSLPKLNDDFSKDDKDSDLIDKTKDKLKKETKDTKKGMKASKDVTKKGGITAFIDDLKFKLKLLKIGLIFLFGFILISIVILEMIFGPIYDVLLEIEKKWDSISLQVNKANNFYSGFGLQSTKEAFYDEVDYLYEKYDEQLDIPLIMATLFYKERGTYDLKYGNLPSIDDGQSSALATKNSIISKLKSEYEKMYETTDEDGLNYTAGKIYRLRRLARNQMESNGFLPGYVPTNPEEIDIITFLDEVKSETDLEISNLIDSIPSLFSSGFDLLNINKNFYNLLQICTGEENIDTTSWGNNEFAYRCLEILNSLIVDAYEIGSINISLTGITVTVYRYEASDDNYRNYLASYYIKNMPEFKSNLSGLSDTKKDEEINRIIKGIYEYAQEFDDIYGYERDASGEEELECEGTLDLDMVSHLGLPVDSTTFKFDSSTGYGLINGTMNNGVNLTASSAGISEGMNVKSIYAGKVTEIGNNNCNTSTNSSCNPLGNYVKIKHEVKGTGKTYKIYSIYTHLKDIKVKKNKKVKKGDIIGHIGNTGDATEVTLHFEIMQDGSYLNPTNLFIKCSSNGLVEGSNKEQIFCYLTTTLKYPLGKATGTMANLQSESGFEPTRVQGDYSDGYTVSKEYTSKVDSGEITKKQFTNNGPGGGGYGLAQWTSSGRKENLYNSIKKDKTRSIGDMEGQLQFLGKEISNKKSWTKLYSDWNNAGSGVSDSNKATRAMMLGFERPADQSSSAVSGRQSNGKKLYNEFKSYKCANLTMMDNLSDNSKIDKYLKWMEKIAKDDSHGYSQSDRNGPNYDCSSFVYYALTETGVIKKESYAFTTNNMGDVLKKNGFKEIKYSRKKLKKGDILVNSSHTTTMYSSTKQVAAHSSKAAKKDQISITNFGTSNYDYIYRLE